MFKNLIKPLSIILSIVVITAGIFYVTHHVNANSIIVDSNLDTVADDGFCTLREAIEKANDTTTGDPHGFATPGECGSGDPTGSDTITFANAMTITLAFDLPTITSPVVIDGVSGIPGLSCGDLPGGTPHNLGVEIETGANSGITLVNGSAGSRINGLVINGESFIGFTGSSAINIQDTSDIQVSCSYLGTDISGNSDEGYSYTVNIRNSHDIIIGNGSLGSGNLIHGINGINVENSSAITIQGNFIGVNSSGTTTLLSPLIEDHHFGINLNGTTSNIQIGGANANQRNVISGFQTNGNSNPIKSAGISSDWSGSFLSDIRIQGNYIGTDRTGMYAIPNNDGINLCVSDGRPGGCPGNIIDGVLIGGSNPGEGNLVAGSAGSSPLVTSGESIVIRFSNGSAPGPFDTTTTYIKNVTIRGNYIGTDATGNAVLAGSVGDDQSAYIFGGWFGDYIENVIIGGTGLHEKNIFAGSLHCTWCDQVLVKNNHFGVGIDGASALPGFIGLMVGSSRNVTVGGSTAVEGNLIAHRSFFGLGFVADTRNSYAENNIIRDNDGMGIIIAEYNRPVAIPDNGTNFLNGRPDVWVINNSIYNNADMGINIVSDLDNDFNPDPGTGGPNLNDISDLDSGPNNNLNYPVIHSITESPAGTLNLSYYLDVPAGSYRIEFYKNPTAGLDSSYHGEGEVLAYVDTFTSTGTMGTKTIALPGTLTDILTGTATECTDSTCTAFVRTSEFGPTVPITAGGGSGAGLDFGDVTTTQTTALSNGAYHILNTNYLGSCIDADTGTAQNTLATADDTGTPTDPSAIVGTCTTPNDDEDGVTFDKGEYTTGDTAVLDITASHPGIINVWVDTNTNGSFLDAGEHVLINEAVVAGSNTMTGFTVPATNGTYPMRVRYVSAITNIYQETPGVASPRGEALDGEVEDYTLQVGPVIVPPPSGGGGGGGGGSSLDLCLNLPNTQTTVPSGYAKVPVDPLTPGVCTTSVAIDLCSNISGIQQTIPSGYEQKADGHCYQKTTTEQKPYTIKIYPLSETGITPPPTSDQCPYFNKYLRLGRKNDTTEVLKWQNFLNTHLKEKLTLTGVYDTETYNAVKRFQETYRPDVLTPWKLKSPTGWTYKTTRMKANQIVGCLEKPVFLEIPKISWVLPAL